MSAGFCFDVDDACAEGRQAFQSGLAVKYCMGIFNILSPVLLLVVLGIVLARVRFTGPVFMGELNRFTFYVALPASLFRAAATSGDSGPELAGILGTLLSASLLAAVAGWMASMVLKLPTSCHSAVSQSSFRSNLAYIGLPVLAYAFEGLPDANSHFATAVVCVAVLTSAYNVLAIIVLQAGRHSLVWSMVKPGARALGTNPLILSCATGLAFHATGWSLPLFLDRTLETTGGAAVPMALICIGGSIAFIKLGKNIAGMAVAVAVKLVVVPALVFVIGTFIGLATVDLRIAMVFASCPTAAAAFVMARQMEADEAVASGSIVLSTIFSALALPLALWLTR
ncbi:MAG: AEC family transporter [Spartobacteria bacterium]